MKGSKVGKVVAMVFVGIGIAAALGLVLGLGIQWLWNQLMPEIFGLPLISYWQAVGLFVLSHLLFKGHNCHGSKHDKGPPWKYRCRPNDADKEKNAPLDPVEEKIRRLLDDGVEN